ncbi:LAME_0G08592g1_1 [Lachancea meyersii CBS 8951]|uniref:LAME_0G08592g1_1 n=1 Tax=Lachancea meyersii CBS 8951 TaxID=1266667 RepID=A0A1G4K8A3_9SACH|nr:LAME_0G08592g1_1 [Lachancea meyersii CBS 8951]
MSDLDALEAEFGRGKEEETRTTAARADAESFELEDGAIKPKKTDKDGKNRGYNNYNNHNNYGSYGHPGLDNITQISAYEEPTVGLADWFNAKLKPYLSSGHVATYLRSLFPVLGWIHHYNLRWLYQDVVAGITVGCVLVPQSMSYAQIATLPPQFGLYSSFVGAFIYSFFATSKDVCIGPVAVMSLQTAKVVSAVLAKLPDDSGITGPVIATALALLCGIISTGLGLLRLGFLVELISTTAVGGFMTGSAVNIIAGQVPALMGYNKKVNTRTSTYKVIISTLKHLPDTKLDAAFGLVPLIILYAWKWICNSGGPRLVERYCRRQRTAKAWGGFFFYAQALRNAVVIIVCTAIAWGISHKRMKNPPISLLGKVPSGLKDVGVMELPDGLLAKIAPELPASVIVLLLEHIAISKAFGRVNDYRVVPDQELIAIGATNLIGTFFNAYPATGSFSRSALKAKCNVSTPLSGLFSGACVLVAIYCLTSAFRFIPKATLSAVIIHAVSDLVASYQTTWSFYRTNPLDFICFLVTVLISVFSSIENGIYFAMCWSVAALLWKVAFPSGQFLGRVEVAEVVNPVVSSDENSSLNDGRLDSLSGSYSDVWPDAKLQVKTDIEAAGSGSLTDELAKHNTTLRNSSNPGVKFHTKWVPFDAYNRETNPGVSVLPPPPGVIVFRPSESWTYVNCSRQYNVIFDEVTRVTRRGRVAVARSNSNKKWNDPGEWTPPRFLQKFLKNKKRNTADGYDDNGAFVERDERPVLRVIAMDWSQVAQADSTGLQTLVDLRKAVSKYADRQVEFHFSGIISPWIKRGLINVGFGTVNAEYADESLLAGHSSYHVLRAAPTTATDPIDQDQTDQNAIFTATGTNTPFFHLEMPDFSQWDLAEASL